MSEICADKIVCGTLTPSPVPTIQMPSISPVSILPSVGGESFVWAAFFTLIVLFIVSIWFDKDESCPREILGYNCRGKGCDHSEKLVADAKKARSK